MIRGSKLEKISRTALVFSLPNLSPLLFRFYSRLLHGFTRHGLCVASMHFLVHFVGGFGPGNSSDVAIPPFTSRHRVRAQAAQAHAPHRTSLWPSTATTTIDAAGWPHANVIDGYASSYLGTHRDAFSSSSKPKCGFLCGGGYSIAGHLPPTVHPMYNRYLPVRILTQERTFL